ncbi:hypothetical protein K7I13_13970 [Brucepastera parasyntrophica]|nr:hypothetical protein [Brucepastera parasyntrophica]ULQ59554.1 hypothetical protein K7I13_13970 [Brucepastera parasyntrophica]
MVFRNDDIFTCAKLVRNGNEYALLNDQQELPVDDMTEIFGTVSGIVRKL